MKGLLYRDFCLIWNGFRKNLLLVLVLYGALAFGMGMNSILSVLVFLTGNYVVAMLSFDESCKWDTYARTLPFSSAVQVAAHYLICLAMIALGALAALALMLSVGLLRGETDAEALLTMAATVTVMTFLVLLYDAMALPLAYRFGAAKAQGSVLIAYAALFAGGFLVLNAIPGALDSVLALLDDEAVVRMWFGPAGAALLLGVGLALFAVSWAASTAIYRHKEF